MQIETRTNIGLKRKDNQDAVGVFKNQKALSLGVVADGMGGHQAGDVASRMTVTKLGESWEANELEQQEEILQWLLREIQAINHAIFEAGNQEAQYFGMGTTVVVVVFLANKILMAHVGDSRGYLLRAGELKQLTDDHSLVNELVKSGEITKEMAANHPRKNILARSLGMPGVVDVDVLDTEVTTEDTVILCSDGLTNMLTDQQISEILMAEKPLAERVDKLIQEANQAGGKDNITVLVAEKINEAREEDQ